MIGPLTWTKNHPSCGCFTPNLALAQSAWSWRGSCSMPKPWSYGNITWWNKPMMGGWPVKSWRTLGVTLKNGTEKKEGKPMPKPWENAEGYHDPTAYHGTKNIIRDEDEQQKRVNTLIFVLKYITRLAGFELLNRIEIKDRKTGREYRWWISLALSVAENPFFWIMMGGIGFVAENVGLKRPDQI